MKELVECLNNEAQLARAMQIGRHKYRSKMIKDCRRHGTRLCTPEIASLVHADNASLVQKAEKRFLKSVRLQALSNASMTSAKQPGKLTPELAPEPAPELTSEPGKVM